MISLVAALLLVSSTANGPPARVGQCKWVHGRYGIYNGAGVRRIWAIGTHRIIDLDDLDDVPPPIAKYEANSADQDDPLFGDFFVCAREPSRPGHMQLVHLFRAKNLIFRGKPFPPK